MLAGLDGPGTMAGMPTGDPARPIPPARDLRGRLLRRLADMLLIAGGLLLAYPLWSAGYAQVQQSRLDTAYRQQAGSFAPVVAAARQTRPHGISDRAMVRSLAVKYAQHLKPGDVVGRLRIPKIDLDRVVQEGVHGSASLDPDGDRALLRNGPVHYGITPLPGEGDPFAVAGHRTTYGGPFYKLDRLKPGDRILVDTPYARLRYRVVRETTVLPTDTSVLLDRGYGLVLTTCTPPYSASHRLVVWAKLVKATPLKGRASSD